MPPTVCLAEFPMAGSTVNGYVCRRRRTRNDANDVNKRQTSALERILRIGVVGETTPVTPSSSSSSSSSSREDCPRKLDCADTTMPDSLALDKRLPTNVDEDERKRLVAARKDFLSIIIRTIILVRRNRVLQRRVNALRAETRRYLRSAASNDPENQRRRRKTLPRSRTEDELVVSSSMDRIVPTGSSLPAGNSSREVTASSDERSGKSYGPAGC